MKTTAKDWIAALLTGSGGVAVHLGLSHLSNRSEASWWIAALDGPVAVAAVYGLPEAAVPILLFLYFGMLALFTRAIMRRANRDAAALAGTVIAVIAVHIGSVLLVASQAVEGSK